MAQSLTSLQSAVLTPVMSDVGVTAGVKITSIRYPSGATAADTAGSQTIVVTGGGYATGSNVYVNSILCNTTYTNTSSLTFTTTATSAGTYQFMVYNTDGSSGIIPTGITFATPPVWVTATGALTAGVNNSSYSQSVSATGTGITYGVTSGTLPTGLSLNSSSGAITGTPTAANTYNFTITATNTYSQSTARAFSIVITNAIVADYVVVAGGGAGGYGSYGTGGGGAGGYLTATGAVVNPGTTYTITVGAGGVCTSGLSLYSSGANSSISGSGFTTVTAIGGGGGGGYQSSYQSGAVGGSGGGGASNSTGASDGKGGKGVYPGSTYLDQARQGYDGGTGNSSGGNASQNGGGGGGAGGAGQSPPNGQASAGYGGVGVANPFSGSTVGQNVSGTYYLAGGGGAGTERNASTGGAGGSGGGGQGSGSGTTYTAGTTNTGGGGGGGGYNGGTIGLNGGSGVVILRVGSGVTAASTTGSPTVATSGAYKFYTFTGSGSITF